MPRGYIATATILIEAPREVVWHALTDADQIEKYLFGTRASSDWRVGSPIVYRGVWQGKAYEDKGKVVENDGHSLLVTTFWSSMSGLPDLPEHYNTVRYELAPEGTSTRLTITQDNNDSKEAADHSEQNWRTVLGSLKSLLEA